MIGLYRKRITLFIQLHKFWSVDQGPTYLGRGSEQKAFIINQTRKYTGGTITKLVNQHKTDLSSLEFGWSSNPFKIKEVQIT